MEKVKLISFKIHGDERGSLISLEGNNNISFAIKRVYYIFNTKKNINRGFHAHKELEQILICISGSCELLLDDGRTKQIVQIKDKDVGLYIGSNIWRDMYNFSPDCVLMVLASDYYKESEYIRNYQEFLEHVS